MPASQATRGLARHAAAARGLGHGCQCFCLRHIVAGDLAPAGGAMVPRHTQAKRKVVAAADTEVCRLRTASPGPRAIGGTELDRVFRLQACISFGVSCNILQVRFWVEAQCSSDAIATIVATQELYLYLILAPTALIGTARRYVQRREGTGSSARAVIATRRLVAVRAGGAAAISMQRCGGAAHARGGIRAAAAVATRDRCDGWNIGDTLSGGLSSARRDGAMVSTYCGGGGLLVRRVAALPGPSQEGRMRMRFVATSCILVHRRALCTSSHLCLTITPNAPLPQKSSPLPRHPLRTPTRPNQPSTPAL